MGESKHGLTRPREVRRGDEMAGRLLRIRNLHEADQRGRCPVCGTEAPCQTVLVAAGAE